LEEFILAITGMFFRHLLVVL